MFIGCSARTVKTYLINLKLVTFRRTNESVKGSTWAGVPVTANGTVL